MTCIGVSFLCPLHSLLHRVTVALSVRGWPATLSNVGLCEDQEPTTMTDLLPLTGVRVLALEQAVAAPLCTRHLADLGADVVKVERPGEGDFARAYDSTVAGLSS